MRDSKKSVAESSRPPRIRDGNESFARHSIYYFIGRLMTGLIGLVSLIAFTRVLSPVDYGRYAVIIAIAGLIAGVGFQWLRQCLVRFGTQVYHLRQFLLGTLGALFASLMMVTIAVAATLMLLNGTLHFKLSNMQIVVICCLTWAQAWFELVADAARTEFKPWRYSSATLLRALLTLVFGVTAAVLTHDVLIVVLGMVVAYLLASTVVTPCWMSGLLRIDLATWLEIRRLMTYGLPLAATLGLQFILDSIDRLMLAGMRGYTEAGVYSSAYNLAQFSIGTLLSSLSLASLPFAVRAFQAGNKKYTAELLGRNAIYGIGIGLPAVIGLVIIAPSLDSLLLGNFVAGKSGFVTIIIAVAIGLAAFRSYCLDIVFMLHQRTLVQAAVVGASAILNIILNVLFIPHWGAIGSALASLVAFVLAFISSLLLSRRLLKIHIPARDLTKILAATALMVLVLIMVMSDRGNWIRLVLAIVCSTGVYGITLALLDVAGIRARLLAIVRSQSTKG